MTDEQILNIAADYRSTYNHAGTSFDDFDELGFARALIEALPTPAPTMVDERGEAQKPIDMVLHCPKCGLQHIDAPETREVFHGDGGPVEVADWVNPPHRSHLCHGCGHIWRPADVPTNGVTAVKTTGKADSPLTSTEKSDGWSPINAQRRQIADLILFGDYRISSPLRWEQGFGDDIEHRFEISNGDERYGIVIIKTKLAAPKAAEKSGRSE